MGRRFNFEIPGNIPSQVRFWEDGAPFRAFIGGLGSGKSFAGAVEILRQPPGTSGLVVAPTYKHLRTNTQKPFFSIVPPEFYDHNESKQETKLANGTEILWRSTDNPDSLRGPNIGWIWGDEYAFVSEESHNNVMGRLRMLPGRMWITTTPQGMNWLYHWVISPEVSLHHAHTKDNPYNIKEYSERLARLYAKDPKMAQQELGGQFVDLSGSKRFPGTLVEACYEETPQLNHPDFAEIRVGSISFHMPESARIYEWPRQGVRYVIGVDVAEGVTGGDDSAIVVSEFETGDICAVLEGEYEPEAELPAYCAMFSRAYNDAHALPEKNSIGFAVIGALRHTHDVPLVHGPDGRPGWRTTAQSKAEMCAIAYRSLSDADHEGRKPIKDQRVRDQIKSIDRESLRGPDKKRKKKVDDLFIAWALADTARQYVDYGDDDVPLIRYL